MRSTCPRNGKVSTANSPRHQRDYWRTFCSPKAMRFSLLLLVVFASFGWAANPPPHLLWRPERRDAEREGGTDPGLAGDRHPRGVRRALGASGSPAAREDPLRPPTARAATCRPPAERHRRVCPCRGVAEARGTRRRRLYERRHRRGGRVCPAEGRCAPGRSTDVRTGRPLDSEREPRRRRSRPCSSR